MTANINFICDKCGVEYWIADDGIAHHWGPNPEEIAYDLDREHYPFSNEVLW